MGSDWRREVGVDGLGLRDASRLNRRIWSRAASRSGATWRSHRDDGRGVRLTAEFPGVSAWDPAVRPTWTACPGAPISAPYLGWI